MDAIRILYCMLQDIHDERSSVPVATLMYSFALLYLVSSPLVRSFEQLTVFGNQINWLVAELSISFRASSILHFLLTGLLFMIPLFYFAYISPNARQSQTNFNRLFSYFVSQDIFLIKLISFGSIFLFIFPALWMTEDHPLIASSISAGTMILYSALANRWVRNIAGTHGH